MISTETFDVKNEADNSIRPKQIVQTVEKPLKPNFWEMLIASLVGYFKATQIPAMRRNLKNHALAFLLCIAQ